MPFRVPAAMRRDEASKLPTPSRITPRAALQRLQRSVGNAALVRLVTDAATREPRTGLPAALRNAVEDLSGLAMDDVRVHYRSTLPATVNAAAYADGLDIHLGPGQDHHLPHEAWHVVQQLQGRVAPTRRVNAVPVNDDAALEREAAVMGARASDDAGRVRPQSDRAVPQHRVAPAGIVRQRIFLWNRDAKESKIVWQEETDPPAGYLASGVHRDDEHGTQPLYVKLSTETYKDVLYGLEWRRDGDKLRVKDEDYERFDKDLKQIANDKKFDLGAPADLSSALDSYRETKGKPPIAEFEFMQRLYGGSKAQASSFLSSGFRGAWGDQVQKDNPRLPWRDAEDGGIGRGCQMAMVAALAMEGTVRFVMDGMKDVKGIIEGTHHKTMITSHELRFALDLLGKTIALPENEGTVTPVDGRNVFFYLNRELVPATHLALISAPRAELVGALARAIADEGENDYVEVLRDRLMKSELTDAELYEMLQADLARAAWLDKDGEKVTPESS